MNQKGYTFKKILFGIAFVLICAASVLFLSDATRRCSEGIDELQKRGLKSIVERAWEGERK